MSGKSIKELSGEVTTMEAIKTMNIYEKMSTITSELKRVAKNLDIGVGKSSYKAVGEADILDAIKPIEEKYGVYSFPFARSIEESSVIESEKIDWNTKLPVKSKQLFLRLMTVYRFVNIDKPDEYIDITSYGDGVDSQDKTPGKAMTYADKYALMKAYKISTGDDPDQEQSNELKGKTYKERATKKSEEPPKQVDEHGKLMGDWQSRRTKLSALGVDLRNENIMQWMANHTGYPNQDVDINDVEKTKKMILAYNTLIKAKEKEHATQ